MYQEESIYNLLPKEKIEMEKQPLYRSLYPPQIAPSSSTFGLKTSSYPGVANINGEYMYPRGAHPLKGNFSTFGKPNGKLNTNKNNTNNTKNTKNTKN